MSNAPQIEDTTQNEQPIAPSFQGPSPMGPSMEGIGQNLLALGGEVQKIAQHAQDVATREVADSAAVAFSLQRTALNNKFTSLKQQDAIERMGPAQDELVAAREKIAKGLPTRAAQIAYLAETRHSLELGLSDISVHTTRERKAQISTTYMGKRYLAARDAASTIEKAATPEDALASIEKDMASAKAGATAYTMDEGFGPEATAAEQAKAAAIVATSAVNRALKSDNPVALETARLILKKHADLLGDDHAKLFAGVDAKQTKMEVADTVDRMFGPRAYFPQVTQGSAKTFDKDGLPNMEYAALELSAAQAKNPDRAEALLERYNKVVDERLHFVAKVAESKLDTIRRDDTEDGSNSVLERAWLDKNGKKLLDAYDYDQERKERAKTRFNYAEERHHSTAARGRGLVFLASLSPEEVRRLTVAELVTGKGLSDEDQGRLAKALQAQQKDPAAHPSESVAQARTFLKSKMPQGSPMVDRLLPDFAADLETWKEGHPKPTLKDINDFFKARTAEVPTGEQDWRGRDITKPAYSTPYEPAARSVPARPAQGPAQPAQKPQSPARVPVKLGGRVVGTVPADQVEAFLKSEKGKGMTR